MSQLKIRKTLFLIGFMGAGKSTVATALSRLSGAAVVDLDRLIEERVGLLIPEIFTRFGEEVFRNHETAALTSLSEGDLLVVATGGGVVSREKNWACMRQLGVVVYLEARWEVLCQRIGSGAGRPLAQGTERARLQELWQSRLPLYQQADVIVNADLDNPDEVARQILEKCKSIRLKGHEYDEFL